MSNLQLPTSGSLNWGPSLNGYLERLSNRVSTLENSIQDVDGSIIKNIGHASSGVVGNYTHNGFQLEDGSWETSVTNAVGPTEGCIQIGFEGNLFIKADITTYFANPIIEPLTINTETTSLAYIYIKYSENETTGEPQFKIEATGEYLDHWSTILIGYYHFREDSEYKYYRYVPVLYSSDKTVSQHRYDRKTRYVDLDTTNSKIIITKRDTNLDVSLTKDYYMGLDGINSTSTSNINYLSDSLDLKEVDHTNNCLYITDNDTDFTFGYKTFDFNENVTLCRILVNVFGDVIIQKANNSSINELSDSNYASNEQLLYNTQFRNYFVIRDTNNKITSSYAPFEMVEIARFGFKTSGDFTYDLTGDVPIVPETDQFAFVMSMDKGLAFSNFNNVWPVLNSKIYLSDNTTFLNNSNATASFQLNYSGPNETKTINLNRNLYSGENSETPNLLFDKTNIIDSGIKLQGKNGVLELGDNIDLQIYNHGLTIDGEDINIAMNDNLYLALNTWGPIHLASYNSTIDLQGGLSTYIKLKILGSDDDVETSLTLNEGTITVTGETTINGDLTIADGYQILFSSDKRRKTNFEAIPESYLHVVNSVPVVGYTYKGSVRQQVGIMAQDLEAALQDHQDAFIDIQDTAELKNRRSLYETKLTYILWKALQEETQARKELEKRLEALENK